MIPAVKYLSIIRQYAIANKMKFWTLEDQMKALANYELFGALKN